MTEQDFKFMEEILPYRNEVIDWQGNYKPYLMTTINSRCVRIIRDRGTHEINGYIEWWELDLRDFQAACGRDFESVYTSNKPKNGDYVYINFIRGTGSMEDTHRLIKKFMKEIPKTTKFIGWHSEDKTGYKLYMIKGSEKNWITNFFRKVNQRELTRTI